MCLRCEVLKDLALSGFKDIEVIDLDTIELSNLNRQFLFRKKDIGHSKAKCAAEFVMKRVPGCKITWHNKKLQDFEPSFYSKFNVVIAGLDNVEARRWLNATLFELVEIDDEGNPNPDSIIPLIDGGTEGFKGQARMFIPRMSSCFECSVGTMAPPKAFANCTIANIPRTPAHCIAYAHKVMWPRLKTLKSASEYDMVPVEKKDIADPCGVKLDTDDVQHMSWIFRRAEERAKQYKIEGVTYNLTMQVVKNIIPAIASTNALISAACVAEALKVLTWCSYGLNNYYMYMGQDGVYSRTWNYQKNPTCPVCGVDPIVYKLDKKSTFESLYQKIKNDPELKLQDPSIRTAEKALFMAAKGLRKMYEADLKKEIKDVFDDGTQLLVIDPVLGKKPAKIVVRFAEGEFYVPPSEE